MGRLFVIELDGAVYRCKYCNTHLAVEEDILSMAFHSSRGQAYLMDKVVNVTVGRREDRIMMTGRHTVVETFCVGCGSLVGWRYEAVVENSQRYKLGRFVLERAQLLGPLEGGNEQQPMDTTDDESD